MATFVALNKTDHHYAGWQKSDSLAFAANDMVVPVLVEEVPHLLPTMPLAFINQPDQNGQSQFVLVALLSIQPGTNLFLHPTGRWLAGYMPAAYRGYPFRLLPDQNGKMVVCFDKDSGLVRDEPMPGDEVFFTSEGDLSEATKNVTKFLELCEKNRQITQVVVNQLAEKGVIREWPLSVSNPQGDKHPLKGLYKADEDALRSLSPDDLADLSKSGGLSIAYAQLLSQHRVSVFPKLFNIRKEMEKMQASSSAEVDVDELFGEGSDTLNFDFLNN